MSHEQLELQRLETENDRLHRRLEQHQDILRSLQYLVDAIHVKTQGQQIDPETLFGKAYANAQAALRTYYDPNGDGR